MSKKSTRIKAPAITTRTEFLAAVDELARIEVELRQQEAERDAQIQAARDRISPFIDLLTEERTRLILSAEKYAEAHRDELLPGKAKSAETPLATYGFRIGLPTLKTLKGWNWDKVLCALRALRWRKLIRVKYEPDKDAIKRLPAARLAEIGCRIDQAEAFYVEPKEQPSATAA